MVEHYKHSGIVPFSGLAMTLLGGAVVAFVVSFAYAYAIVYMPFVYLSFFAPLLFGGLIGWVVVAAARTGKIRNVGLVGVAGLLLGCLGLYFAWAADFIARMGRMDVEVEYTLSPLILWRYASVVAQEGAWSLRGMTPTGIWLVAIWIIEGLMIALTACLVPVGMMLGNPFCEACKRWIAIEKDVLRLQVDQEEDVLRQLELGDSLIVTQLPIAGVSDGEYMRVDLAQCPTCTFSSYLTVASVRTTMSKDGKASLHERDLVELQCISGTDAQSIRETGKRAQAQAEAETQHPAADEAPEVIA